MDNMEKWFSSQIEKYEDDLEFRYEGLLLKINEQIIELMKNLGISRAEMAQKLNCSSPYITKLLRGDQNLTVKKLLQIAGVLNVNLSVDLSEKPDKNLHHDYFHNHVYHYKIDENEKNKPNIFSIAS